MLEQTIALVTEKFAGKVDSGGDTLVNHMRRVADAVPDQFKVVAWLHDLIEDTKVTLDDLRELGYPEDVIKSVDLLTHRKKQTSYADYITRIIESKDPAAIIVKLADQQDNLDPHRWLTLNKFAAMHLRKRYAGVWERLLTAAAALT